jgi:hypothetical protein
MNRRERPPKLSHHAKDTARPAFRLFSDYIWEGAGIAQRKEKQESTRKTFLQRKSRLSIFRKVAEYNLSLNTRYIDLLLRCVWYYFALSARIVVLTFHIFISISSHTHGFTSFPTFMGF